MTRDASSGDAVHTLVTGATRGIGRAIVERLLAAGEPVVGVARNPDPTFPAPLICADLADPSATAEALTSAAARWPIGRLVNNAGFNTLQPLGSITGDAFEQIMALNCRSAIDCTQALLGGIRAARDAQGRPAGRIVNISSRSLLGRLDGSVYAAAKAALVGFTRSWALELAREGITVNCVAPGPVATEMFDRNNPPGDPRRERMLGAVPMQRVGTPDEIAGAVGYFLSDSAGFTTGQTLFVCGGASISQIHL
ncbi:MAG: SDR family oxidoreductase [Gammaproteobacteria bacterium]|nr:SDR family oxidoreductase [Gammaproteobacteria bacterium]